jgi:hypothetical protein
MWSPSYRIVGPTAATRCPDTAVKVVLRLLNTPYSGPQAARMSRRFTIGKLIEPGATTNLMM